MPTTDTFYSAAGDGMVRNAISTSGNTWATCRNASTGTSAFYTDTNTTFCEASNNGWSDSKYYIDRGFLPFDTSSIPDNATISSATLGIYFTGKSTGAGGSIVPVASTVSSTTVLATTDFGSVGSTEFCDTRQTMSAITTGAYTTFALNAAGIAAISLSGYTKFAIRCSFDIDNSAPSSNTLSYLTADLSEASGTSTSPYLSVTYTVPVTKTFTADAIIEEGSSRFLSDSFTDTNGTAITSHTSDSGHSWSRLPGAADVGYPMLISNNALTGSNLGTGIDGNYYSSAVPSSADYSVFGYFSWPTSTASGRPGIWGRLSTSAIEGYCAFVDETGTMTLYRYGGSGTSSIGSASVSLTAGVVYQCELSMVGTAIKVYWNGVEKISVTETSITAAGRPGVRMYDASTSQRAAVTDLHARENPPVTTTFTVDGIVKATSTKTFTADAIIDSGIASRTKTFTADALVGYPVTADGVSQAISVGTITAGSGATDSLNYNAFPGLTELPPTIGTAGSRSNVLTPADTAANLITNNGLCITAAGTYLVCSPSASGEFYGAVDQGFWIARSTNQGSTWTRTKIQANSGGDSAIWQVPTGFTHAGRIYATRTNYYTGGYEEGVAHNLMQYSDDDGVTWSAIATADHWTVTGGAPPWVVATSTGKWTLVAAPAVASRNGTDLLLPTYRRTLNSMSDLDFFVVIRKSSDGGDTWSDMPTSPFPYVSGYRFEEPTLTYRKDGALLCAARVATPAPAANMWMNVSYDDGLTWGTAQRVFGSANSSLGSGEFWVGGRATIHTASNGAIVTVQRNIEVGGSGSTLFATSPDGFTWSTPVDIGGGPADLVTYGPGGAGTDTMSMYGAFANDVDGTLVCCYSVEYAANTGGVYMRKFAAPDRQHLVAYHHANDHTGSTSAKIDVKIGGWNGGHTAYSWGSATTLATGSGVNLADVGCITLTNGDVMVCWNESTTPGTANINTVVNWKYRKSSDGGATWASAVSQAVPGWATTVTAGAGGGAYAIASNKPIQLANGDLLMAVYGWDNRAISDFSIHEYVKCVKSTDMGATWSVVGTIFADSAIQAYDETDLLLLDDGVILAACRKIVSTGYNIVVSRSEDSGVTWSAESIVLGTSSTTGWGGRPDLIQTPNGGVLLRTRYMSAGTSSWSGYRLSLDRGATWGSGIDPYTGGAEGTGTVSGSGRGLDVYGAFASMGQTNRVAYAWSEELGSTSSVLYFNVLDVYDRQTATFTADAQVRGFKAFTADAVIVSGVTTSNTRTFTADAIVQAKNVTSTFTVDAIITSTSPGLVTYTKTFTANAVITGSPGATATAGLFFYSSVGQDLEFWGQE